MSEIETGHLLNLSANLFFKVEEFIIYKDETRDCRKLPRPFNAIFIMQEGEAEFQETNGNVITIKAGDVVFVPMWSKYFSEWKADVNKKMVLFFASETLNFKLDRNYPIQKIEGITIEDIQGEFKRAIECADGEFAFFETFSILSSLCARILPLLKRVSSKTISPEIQKAIAYMALHCDDTYNMNELLQFVLMSESRFYTLFKKEMGVTPIMYINHLKVNKAINLMAQGISSIEELAYLSGFNSSVYFRRVFKNITGCNPTFFIKHNKNYYI